MRCWRGPRPRRPLPPRGSLYHRLNAEPWRSAGLCCLAWHPVCSPCAVPRWEMGRPICSGAPRAARLLLLLTLCLLPSLLSPSPLAQCCWGSHPPNQHLFWVHIDPGLGAAPEYGTLFQEGRVLLCSASQGAAMAVSRVGSGPVGLCWGHWVPAPPSCPTAASLGAPGSAFPGSPRPSRGRVHAWDPLAGG